VAVVAAGALVAGTILGLWVGRGPGPLAPDHPAAPAGPTRVAAGAIEQEQSVRAGWEFVLPVLNASDSPVRVELRGLTDLLAPVRREAGVRVAPGSWGRIRFSVPASCDTPTPGLIPSVGLRVEAAGGRAVAVTAPLQGAGGVLVDYLRALCGAGRPARPHDLPGTWIVDRAYGPERYVAGRQLIRFTRDGTFAADPDGLPADQGSGLRGGYRLRGEVMVISTENSAGCGAGSRATWRATVDAEDRLTMVYLGGDCPEGQQGNVWVSHRITRG
jgi:hypothetical protein